MDGEYQIAMENIEVSYPLESGGCKIILSDIDLFVRAGEFVTVVGPSGCGKSTVLRLILGSQFPTRGSVRVDGETVRRVSRDRGIVYQKYSLFPHLTVVENIALGLELENAALAQRFFLTPGFREVRRRTRSIGTFVNDASIERIVYGLVAYHNAKYATRICPAFRKLGCVA